MIKFPVVTALPTGDGCMCLATPKSSNFTTGNDSPISLAKKPVDEAGRAAPDRVGVQPDLSRWT